MNKKNAEEKYKKILIIRFSSLGDVILTTPLIKHVKENFPNSQIDFCTREECSEALNFNPYINNIIKITGDFEFGQLKLLRRKLDREKYDLIIDAHNNARTFYLRQFLRFRSRTIKFRKYSFRKFLLVKFKINLMKNLASIPIIDRYLKLLAPVQHIKPMPGKLLPEIFTDNISAEKVDGLFQKLGIDKNDKIICIAPVSKHFTKTYPVELYIELINKIDNKIPVLLVGKGNDIINIKKIKEKTGSNVHDLGNMLGILELTELIKKCTVFISGDTGPMHIAEAMNVPVITLAGSSVKEFGFYPQSELAVILENNNLNCRPCSHIGRSSCPKGHFKCMKEISPEMILNEINILLS